MRCHRDTLLVVSYGTQRNGGDIVSLAHNGVENDRYRLSIHHHGNVEDSNHDDGTQLNKDFKVFKKHRANDLITMNMMEYIALRS